jgi:hypothetical protein
MSPSEGMHRINVTLEDYHYRAYVAIAKAIGVPQTGTALRIVLQRHADNYIREHSAEIKAGFIQQEINLCEPNKQNDTSLIVRESKEGIDKRHREQRERKRQRRKAIP